MLHFYVFPHSECQVLGEMCKNRFWAEYFVSWINQEFRGLRRGVDRKSLSYQDITVIVSLFCRRMSMGMRIGLVTYSFLTHE